MCSDLSNEVIDYGVITAKNIIVLIECTNCSCASDSFLHERVLLNLSYIFEHDHLSIKVHKQELKLVNDISH